MPRAKDGIVLVLGRELRDGRWRSLLLSSRSASSNH